MGFIPLAAALWGDHARTAPALGSDIAVTPHDLEALLDEVIGEGMAPHHVPGAALTVVRDGSGFLYEQLLVLAAQNHVPLLAGGDLRFYQPHRLHLLHQPGSAWIADA